jgi:two-component system, NarL family, sensor histidine kinase UhpB
MQKNGISLKWAGTYIINLFHHPPFPLFWRGMKGEANKQKTNYERGLIRLTCIGLLAGFACATATAQAHKREVETMKFNTDSLLVIINNSRSDTGKVDAYHMLGAIIAGTDASRGVEYSKKGIVLARQLNYQRGMALCMSNASYCYGLQNNLPKAVLYIDSAAVLYKKLARFNTLIFCYRMKAEYNLKLGRLKQSLNDCDTAMFYAAKTGNKNIQRYVYKIMAAVYYAQGDNEQSKLYYEKAYAEHVVIKDTVPMADILSKLGSIYERKKEYEQSISSLEKAIVLAILAKQENNLSEYYNNLSSVWLKKGDKQQALANALKAVEIAKAKKNKTQLAAAQSILSNIYLKTDSTAAAIKSATEGFSMANLTKATETSMSSAAVLAEGYFRAGDFKNAYTYLKINQTLSDSLVKVKFDEDLAAIQTRFRVNEKDKEILLLNKDKQLQVQQLKQQRFLMGAAAAIVLLLLLGIGLFINRNRLRQRMKELELRNQIAADLHDEVGSSLSSIHMLSQMATKGSEGSNKDILDRMSNNAKETMDRMGDIVWMIKPGETEAGSLRQRMERFAYVIGSSKNLEMLMELDDLEKVKLTMEQRKNIYLIFKEAVNNAVKYADTEKMAVRATLQHKELVLRVQDFGKGFDSKLIQKGNGLDNMQHRAKELQGTIQIMPEAGVGTTILLTIPVSSS